MNIVISFRVRVFHYATLYSQAISSVFPVPVHTCTCTGTSMPEAGKKVQLEMNYGRDFSSSRGDTWAASEHETYPSVNRLAFRWAWLLPLRNYLTTPKKAMEKGGGIPWSREFRSFVFEFVVYISVFNAYQLIFCSIEILTYKY